MKETKYLIVVGAIVEKDGNILLVKEKKPQAGLWNTPAGRLEQNENALEGAIREIKEETGFDIEINSLIGVYVGLPPGYPDTIGAKIIFRGSIVGGELKFSKDELLDAKWFKPSDVLVMKDSQLRNIKGEIEDFVAGKSYPIEIIRRR